MTADRPARVEDVHEFAQALPHVSVVHGSRGNAVYQVGGRSFVFFRTTRPDAVDVSGQKLPDVIVFWVESEADKQALVQASARRGAARLAAHDTPSDARR